MKPWGAITAGLAVCLGLMLTAQAPAQLPWRWFGSKSTDKTLPAKAADPRRAVEINVEVAWLADPVTFPYYLEARINNSQQLEVRGYIPNQTVREHALRTAQVYSSLPVLDSMKEHASLLVRPGQMSPAQLQSSVQSSLKVALPKQAPQLKVECGGDGKVYVFGQVNSLEEKIAVSHSLRRLHGCTSVQNMTSIPTEVALQVPTPEPKTVGPVDNKSKSWFPWSTAKAPTNQEPPLADPPNKEVKSPVVVDVVNRNSADGPILIPGVPGKEKRADPGTKAPPEVINVELPAAPKTAAPWETDLQKRIQHLSPKVKNVEVHVRAGTELSIRLEVPSADDINPIAERIFAMPELQKYRPDLQFKIGSP